MNETLICIPSSGRSSKQPTLSYLRQAGVLNRTLICVPEAEVARYKGAGWGGVTAVPSTHTGISRTREWILTDLARGKGVSRVLMVDDDMSFYHRPTLGDYHLRDANGEVMKAILQQLDDWMGQGFVHVGLSARQGNNRHEGSYVDVTRMMNTYQYDVAVLGQLLSEGKIKMGRVPVMEDFDLTLQLLRLGYPNRVSYQYAWGQKASGAEGGCSQYRTGEMQAAAAHKLAELHPGFVKVTEKATKTGWGDMREGRTDVIVFWKKAYEAGRNKADDEREWLNDPMGI